MRDNGRNNGLFLGRMNGRVSAGRPLCALHVMTLLAALVGGGACAVQAHPEEAEPGQTPSMHPDRITVTWKNDPATSLSVTWRTDPSVDEGKAQIAPAKASPDFSEDKRTISSTVTDFRPDEGENKPAHYHSATFNDLKPGTLYAYRVGHEDHWSEWLQVETAKQNMAPFSFIYLGDAQNGIHSKWSRAIRAAYSKATPRADFIVHAGDLVNRGHRNVEWGRWHRAGGWIQRTLPNIAVPGNHEYFGGLSVHWRPQFEFPRNGPSGLKETAYYLDYQNVRFIALNSNEKIEKQAKWLESVLKNNPSRWTIVIHHHPIYASAADRDNPKLRKHWNPLYQKYSVDLVLQGHDHTYARGRDRNVKSGVNLRAKGSGTVYVNSVSGAKMYSIRDQRWNTYGAKMERAAENTQLFQVIDLSAKRLEYRAYTVTGELYDAFDLVKSKAGDKNKFVEKMPDTPERTHENTQR